MAVRTLPARWFTAVKGTRQVDLIVLHSMEAPEKGETAESVARYFQGLPASRKASAHYNIDVDSIVRSVNDNDVAFAAPGANHNGLQFEHAGYARQKRGGWLDAYSKAMLLRSARLAARKCAKYKIPIRYVDAAGLKRGERGITTHHQVTLAFRRSTHTDPGKGFPIRWYLDQVLAASRPRTYTVKPGDTIASIAKVHDITVVKLWRLNRPKVAVGERLRVR